MVAIVSFFIPTRGKILGISSANLLVLCCGCSVFFNKLKKTQIPVFYLIYTIVTIICMLYHFTDRSLYLHIIEIVQIVGVAYLVVVSINTRQDFEKILKYITVIFAIYGLLGIIESLFHFNIFDALTNTQVVYEHANGIRFGLARSRGACGTSIHNGMLLVLVLSLVTYCLINAKKREKKLYFTAYILIVINCFCTLSRGVWLEVVISQILIFLALRTTKQVKIVFKIVVGIGILLCLLYIIAPSFIKNVGDIISEMFGSVINTLTGTGTSEVGDEGDRLLLWGWVWSTVQSHATWGLGYAAKFAYLTPAGYIKESIEVMWLYKLYQIGFVGLVGYIFLQVSSLIYFVKYNFKKYINKDKINFNYVLLMTSIAYFITQFSCAGSEDLRFFYFVLALAFAYNKIIKKENRIRR